MHVRIDVSWMHCAARLAELYGESERRARPWVLGFQYAFLLMKPFQSVIVSIFTSSARDQFWM